MIPCSRPRSREWTITDVSPSKGASGFSVLLRPAGKSSLAGGGTGGELPPLGFTTLDRDPVSLAEQGTGTLPRRRSKPSSCNALRDRRAPAAHGFPTDVLGEQLQPLQTSRSQISHHTQNQVLLPISDPLADQDSGESRTARSGYRRAHSPPGTASQPARRQLQPLAICCCIATLLFRPDLLHLTERALASKSGRG